MSRLAQIRDGAVDATCGHRVVFHHVPKCGGTSIERALRMRYMLSYATFPLYPLYMALEILHPNCRLTEPDQGNARFRRLVELDQKGARFQEVKLLSLMYNDVRCIAGHVFFSDTAHRIFASRYHFITTLRNPVDFFYSFFFQMAYAKEELWKLTCSFEEFLETPHAKLFGKLYVLYFSGWKLIEQEPYDLAIQHAKENLAKLTIVGLLDDMPRFEKRLIDILGVRLWISHANKSKASQSERASIITPSIRRKIEAISAANIEIYEFAKRELAR